MTKRSALGSSFFVGIRDISGDIGAVSSIASKQAVQNISGIDAYGTERLGLRRDGLIAYASFWNPDSARAVAVLSDIADPTQVTVVKGPGGLGADAASIIAVRTRFTTVSGQDGSLGATGEAMGSAGVPLEWGKLLTAGKQTFGATQAIAAWQALHDYALNDLVQPTTPNGHFYKGTADAGSSAALEPTWPTNGTTVVDDGITWTDQGLLPNGIDRGSGSASDHGAAAYLHAFSIGSGSATIVVQDSADRIAWADVPGLAFAAVTAAGTERVATSATENVKRYVRAYLTGTFGNLVAAISVVPYRA